MSKCIQPYCKHYHSDYDGMCLIPGCTCSPELFIPENSNNPVYKNFAFHQKILSQMQDVHQKVAWMLTSVDDTRNMSDWEFICTCWNYFIGFRFGTWWDKEVYEKIKNECQPETIRRARQKVCHEELEQLRLFQEELKELQKAGLDGSSRYWDLTKKIKEFWLQTKYIPNDIGMLKKKQIKESAIFEYSIQGIEDIYAIVAERRKS